ncbi:DUF1566 domain-containing protein [Parabacteroides sp. GYB001]|uniref:Lcl C-terminal domain-containing protein n=1 Tax=Parabacteroides leei TaxID=2939491 RepID=UPI002017175A|nr:DUF1566 domain-containing protein [Parabacteroides leei]MCL3850845.1 DUF1566 domain-containing protein [Parabacteroides leei]
MNKTLHSGASRLLTLIYALLLSGILPACTDDAERELPDKGKGETATLELSLSVPPIVETKAVICETDSGSEARKAGFNYEMQVLTTDTAKTTTTKAASSLKNIYAFLFKSDGAFNGRASLTTANTGSSVTLVFTNIADASAANGRLLIIANDEAGNNYTSSTAFSTFNGNYAAFQNLTLTNDVTKDTDIPYVGSATVTLSHGSFTAVPTVQLYRMLAQINLTNNTFSIEGGPFRNAINLYNAGKMYFGTSNNYDGTGSTVTASDRYLTTATTGKNENSNIWYVGENVQTTADANKAAYIRLETNMKSVAINTSPDVGQEYVAGGGYTFTYDVYLKNIALRRNNIYNITVNVSGTLAKHLELAATAGSNVTVSNTVVKGGLNIGRFGGASNYTTGTGAAPTITGSYTKDLLIQPNTSGSTATDNVTRKWSDNTTTQLQSENRKHWDHTYTLNNIDKAPDTAYEYCHNLTIGGVAKGTWYLPAKTQLMAVWGILRGIQDNSVYADYSAFRANAYWSSSEYSADLAWYVGFYYGNASGYSKTNAYRVRCVRDL